MIFSEDWYPFFAIMLSADIWHWYCDRATLPSRGRP